LSLELGECDVVTIILGSSTPAQAYSSSMWVVTSSENETNKYASECIIIEIDGWYMV
jgi:hypothetical protein